MTIAYCFDLDGTLTQAELLPAIAAEAGLSEEMETLTRATMDGLIPFGPSLRLRAALLSQVPLQRVQSVVADVPLQEEMLSFISGRATQCFIITGNLDVWLAPLRTRVGCTVFSSAAQYESGRLMVTTILDKGDCIEAIRSRGFDRVVAVGEGANDCEMFKHADIAVAYGGIHAPSPASIEVADFIAFEGKQLCLLLAAL